MKQTICTIVNHSLKKEKIDRRLQFCSVAQQMPNETEPGQKCPCSALQGLHHLEFGRVLWSTQIMFYSKGLCDQALVNKEQKHIHIQNKCL